MIQDLLEIENICDDSLIALIKEKQDHAQPYLKMGSKSLISFCSGPTTKAAHSETVSVEYANLLKEGTKMEKEMMPAHIFSLANAVYAQMIRNQEDQCIFLRYRYT